MATKTDTIPYSRNTTLPITYIYQKDGVPSTDGVTLFFTVKAVKDDAATDDATAIVKKTVSFSGSSSASFTIDPGDVSDNVAMGNYFYDFKVKESSGPPPVIFPGVSGIFALDVEPTNRET